MKHTMLLMTGVLAAATIGCTTQEPYDAADTNKDGAVNTAEFDAYMKPAVFDAIDANDDASVSMAEWQAVNPGKSPSKFKEADRNGDGGVTRAEADAQFDRKGALSRMFKQIDTNGDGTLSRGEAAAFREMVTAQPGATKIEQLSNATK